MSKKDTTNIVQEIQSEFTKEQLVSSARYQNRRDLLNILLDKGKKYTVEAVNKIINDFMKGKVK